MKMKIPVWDTLQGFRRALFSATCLPAVRPHLLSSPERWFTSPPPLSTAEIRGQHHPRSLSNCLTSVVETPSASTEVHKALAWWAAATMPSRQGGRERKLSRPWPT